MRRTCEDTNTNKRFRACNARTCHPTPYRRSPQQGHANSGGYLNAVNQPQGRHAQQRSSPLAREHTHELVAQALVLPKQEADLAAANTDVTSGHVCLGTNVPAGWTQHL